MFLDKICEDKRVKVEKKKLAIVEKKSHNSNLKFKRCSVGFYEALNNKSFSYIGELKKASPSKGVISNDFPFEEILKSYERNKDISAISILTEENYFLGSLDYLEYGIKYLTKPVLRKDFIIDKYEIYESYIYGASAILLIVAILNEKIYEFYDYAKALGLDILVEVHSEEEIDMVRKLKPNIVGINNRNLKTFAVDLKNTENLMKFVDWECILISESGVCSEADIEYLKGLGVRGCLIGEYFMRGNIK
ncbi:MAG: indole-3-glycerol phosphate synthase TrpC [Sarcina sp.]